MNLKSLIAAISAAALSCSGMLPSEAFGQATILPPGETCFQATTGINGMIGLIGTITGGSSYTAGTYGGVALTGGSGTGATANITVSGGIVTGVTVLNPGWRYVVGDVLSAASASIGGTGSGFSFPVSSTSINSSLAGGTVGFYIPNEATFKQTWQDSGQNTLNSNPVPLDANGCAVIYGSGVYRQVLQDSLGNTVWDQLTASTSPVGVFWAGQAGGTGNAITIVDSAFASQDGAMLQFLALAANTGPTTIAISGGSPIAIVNDTATGPAALSGGEIGPGNAPMLTYDAINAEFHLVNPAAATSSSGASASLIPPQGYLNLVGQGNGDVVQTGDVTAAAIFYSPFVGNQIPIWNGTTFKLVTFSELTANLTSAGSPINAIQDECVFSNNGVPTLVTAPAWSTATAGAGNRGTGAGTAQITRLQGIWVNAVSIVAYNGLSSYTIAASQCTYVGSISIDSTAGQVTAQRSYGQNRKWGIWNAYNRQPIALRAGTAVTQWSNSSATIRASDADSNNSLTIFSGLPEDTYNLTFSQLMTGTATVGTAIFGSVGIGYNSITTTTGTTGSVTMSNAVTGSFTFGGTAVAFFNAPPALGINVITSLESGNSVNVGNLFKGTETNMLLAANWRG